MRNRQHNFRTETRGDEERGILENPQNPGFSWAAVRGLAARALTLGGLLAHLARHVETASGMLLLRGVHTTVIISWRPFISTQPLKGRSFLYSFTIHTVLDPFTASAGLSLLSHN